MKQFKNYLVAVCISVFAFSAVIYTSCQKNPTCSSVCQNGGYCANGICRCPSGYYGTSCQYSKITYYNNTFTTISLSIFKKYGKNYPAYYPLIPDTLIYLPPNQTVDYYGIPTVPGKPNVTGDTAIAVVYTYGPVGPTGHPKTDTMFGERVNWDTIKTAFVATGTVNVNLDVRTDYFFLQIKNMDQGNLDVINVNSGFVNWWDTIAHTSGAKPLFYSGYYYVKDDGAVHNIGYFGYHPLSNVSFTAADTIYTTIPPIVDSVVLFWGSTPVSCGLPGTVNQSFLWQL